MVASSLEKLVEAVAEVAQPVAQKAAPEDVVAKRIAEGRCPKCGKPVFRPNGDGVGSTCAAHEGKLFRTAVQATEVPEGWLGMSKVCRALETQYGFRTGEIVRACGGDACTEPTLGDIFVVTYVGKRKFLNPVILVDGPAMLLKAREDAKAEIVATNAKAASGKGQSDASTGTDTANALKAVVKPGKSSGKK